MEIYTEQNNGTVVLRLEGRLDTITAPELETVINALEPTVTDLVLDMKGIEYISSAGLRILLGAQKKMNKQGTMKLIEVRDAIMEILEMTGFAEILTIE